MAAVWGRQVSDLGVAPSSFLGAKTKQWRQRSDCVWKAPARATGLRTRSIKVAVVYSGNLNLTKSTMILMLEAHCWHF